MPHRVDRRRLAQGVGCCAPLAGGLLPGENEASSMRAGEAREKGREILPTPFLWVGNGFHGTGQFIGLDRVFPVVLPPCAEKVRDALAVGITGFERFNPLDGIMAAESHQRITAPFCPGLKTSQGLPTDEPLSLAPPAPNCERRRQETGAALLELREKAAWEGGAARGLRNEHRVRKEGTGGRDLR